MTTTTVPEALTGIYEIDPHDSRIGFTVRSLLWNVGGSFRRVEGAGCFDTNDPRRSNIALRIDAASIDTENAKRDAHLRSDSFLAADTHPDITFTSTAVDPISDDRYRVTGDLTIKGTTHPVTVEVRRVGASVDETGMPRVDFEGHTVVRRTDWGVQWNAILEAGGLVIGNKVHVGFSVSAVRRGVD